MKSFKITLLFLVVTLIGCMPTNITSIKDPQYKGKFFGKVLVEARGFKLKYIKELEDMIVDEMQFNGIYAIANHKLFPPLREYSLDERKKVVEKENLDSYLIVMTGDVEESTIYVPSRSTTTASVYGNQYSATGKKSTVTYHGGERRYISGINNKIKLLDLNNGNVVWYGESHTNADPYFSSIDVYLNTLSSEIVYKLIEDKVLKAKDE